MLLLIAAFGFESLERLLLFFFLARAARRRRGRAGLRWASVFHHDLLRRCYGSPRTAA